MVNVVAALNPVACVAGINVGRCLIFIGKSKFDNTKTFSQVSFYHFHLLNDVGKIVFVLGCVRAVAILT